MTIMRVAKGDRFVQQSPEARWPVFIEVTRVGRSGWVDIRCETWLHMWTKRMPKGLGPMLEPDSAFHIEPMAWTAADVAASAPAERAEDSA